jgi:hypothetical protein
MTAPDRMPEAFENSLHDAGHPHMEPPANPGRFKERIGAICRQEADATAVTYRKPDPALPEIAVRLELARRR